MFFVPYHLVLSSFYCTLYPAFALGLFSLLLLYLSWVSSVSFLWIVGLLFTRIVTVSFMFVNTPRIEVSTILVMLLLSFVSRSLSSCSLLAFNLAARLLISCTMLVDSVFTPLLGISLHELALSVGFVGNFESAVVFLVVSLFLLAIFAVLSSPVDLCFCLISCSCVFLVVFTLRRFEFAAIYLICSYALRVCLLFVTLNKFVQLHWKENCVCELCTSTPVNSVRS